MSVIEPFVLGLAITELTSNLLAMANGVAGAGINTSYIAVILVIYLLRGLLYELGSYYFKLLYDQCGAVHDTGFAK